MQILEKISSLAGRYMALIIVIISAGALFIPAAFTWINLGWINPLLGIVIFGMGLTLKLSDFKEVFTQPKSVLIGLIAQFTLMPSLAYLLVRVFNLPMDLAIGVILVGCAPGGTASNVITFLAKGDVALSVCMTTFSTLCAPILTPFLIYLLLGAEINVNYSLMFLSIVKIVIIPIVLGLIFSKFLGKLAVQLKKVLPLISVIGIVTIIAAIICVNSTAILNSAGIICATIITHNLLGFLTGFSLAKVFKLPPIKCNTISIEVGMQNSGLAVSLALVYFASMPAAAIAGALFSVWHNISGSILANLMALKTREYEAIIKRT